MEVTIKNHQKKIQLKSSLIRKITKTILHREGIAEGTLNVVFVSHQTIRALNKKFLKRNYATDVLAFDLQERSAQKSKSHNVARLQVKKIFSGEIIISTDAALGNSRIYKNSLDQELTLYIIHGILHLMGFHDHGSRNTKKMRDKEQELLKYLFKDLKYDSRLVCCDLKPSTSYKQRG